MLAVNRQIAMGEKTGIPVRSKVRNLILTSRPGGSLALYNRAHLGWERSKDVLNAFVLGPISTALSLLKE